MAKVWERYFDPPTLAELSDVRLRWSQAAEGALAGRHRNPRHGHSIEFSEHRPYVPGDDPRSVDWKVFARTDRFFLQNREDETTLVCHLLLDGSGSMTYRGPRQPTDKFQYAARVAAAIAFVGYNGQDAISLQVLGGVSLPVPIGTGQPQLMAIAEALARTQPGGEAKIAASLIAVAGELQRRGLAVVISDLLDDADAILRAVKRLRYAGHDVIVIQVLDPTERDLDPSYAGTTHFEGLEGEAAVDVQPQLLRGAYRQAVRQFTDQVRDGCLESGARFLPLSTDQTIGPVLASFLAQHEPLGPGLSR